MSNRLLNDFFWGDEMNLMPARLRRRVPDDMLDSIEPNDMFVLPDIKTTCIRYTCPCCWSKYTKSGRPYKRAKRLIHEFDFTISHNPEAAIVVRQSHCDQGYGPNKVLLFVDY